MSKKYFVMLCDHCDPDDPDYNIEREVSRDEYIRLANQEIMARDAETKERIMENATYDAAVCGTKHMFWTQPVAPDYSGFAQGDSICMLDDTPFGQGDPIEKLR